MLDACLLTGATFVGLTSYVLVTKRGFSLVGAWLSMGSFVVLGASLLGLFLRSAMSQLAVSSVGVLLFCGYIVFDAARALQTRDDQEPIGAALRLWADVMNLFLFLLRLLSPSRPASGSVLVRSRETVTPKGIP